MTDGKQVSSEKANELLKNQIKSWPLARKNYKKLHHIRVHSLDMGGFIIRVQFTPSRILSSSAKIDFRSLSERPCFLCKKNLEKEQISMPFENHFHVLCNPYPIFPEHFTVPLLKHSPQEILSTFEDFLKLCKYMDKHTIFYNGPKSGASAPDHLHFQAVTRNIMPMDMEIDDRVSSSGEIIMSSKDGTLYSVTHYLRNGFVIKTSAQDSAVRLFKAVYNALPLKPDEDEPRMNLFGSYLNGEWTLIIIPRREHRPKQFYAEGYDKILVSPGAADMGGLFVIAREEDFEKINVRLLRDIFKQVCFSDPEIEEIASHIRNIKESGHK